MGSRPSADSLAPHSPHLLETGRIYLPFIKRVIAAIHTESQKRCTEARGRAPGTGNCDPVILSDSWEAAFPSSAPHTAREKTESTLSLLLLSRMKKERECLLQINTCLLCVSGDLVIVREETQTSAGGYGVGLSRQTSVMFL